MDNTEPTVEERIKFQEILGELEYRAIPMTIDQVTASWETLWAAIEVALPPIANPEFAKENILSLLLTEKMAAWSVTGHKGDFKTLIGFFTTTFTYDFSGGKNLLIYSVYGINLVPNKAYSSAIRSIVKYAYSQGCDAIVAYSSNPAIIRRVEQLDGDTSYRFLRIPL